MANIPYRKVRREVLFKKNPYCFWCGRKLVKPEKCDSQTQENMATLDHLRTRYNKKYRRIPNINKEKRIVLACYRCNQLRSIPGVEKLNRDKFKRLLKLIERQDKKPIKFGKNISIKRRRI